MKTHFTQTELLAAVTELQKVWHYEKSRYEKNLSQEEINDLDQLTISYGISLGILRKLFL